MKPGLLNPANVLTSTRLFILPVIVWGMVQRHVWLTLALLIYSGVVDLVDGKVARYFKCSSTFGEMLDAISDAALFLIILVTAALTGYADPVPVAVFLALGVVNAFGRVIHIRRVGRVTNFRSYASEMLGGTSFFLLVAVLLDFYVETCLWWMSALTLVVVVHDYVRILTLPVDGEVPHV